MEFILVLSASPKTFRLHKGGWKVFSVVDEWAVTTQGEEHDKCL
jgi:hypothetical protein